MKFSLLIFFTFFGHHSFCQDTLRDITANMYGMNYFLYEDNHFRSRFVHCTGISYGEGTYEKKWRKIILDYNSIPELQTTYQCHYNEHSDSVTIQLFNARDSSACFSVKAMQGATGKISLTNSVTLPLTADSIRVKTIGSAEITLYPQKDQCNNYVIYLVENYVQYEESRKVILKERKKNQYCLPYVYHDENPEKPWKKGKKRKGATIYLLIPGTKQN